MQLAVLHPLHARHLCDFFMHFAALGLECFGRIGRQLESQFPGEQLLLFRVCLESLMQAFGAVLRQGFAPGLGYQRVKAVQFGSDLRLFAQESVQCKLVRIVGCRHRETP